MAAPASAAAGRGGAMSSDNAKGLVLAVSSSAFIGASFIVKKMGLRRAADSGVRAGYGGFSYLVEPLWWIGMISMIVGEIANFAAYAFAPAILVTPLGALSIIISAALAHAILQEKLHTFGILGCVLCVVGSITIVLHAPQERDIDSVKEVWDLATEPAFLCYAAIVVAAALVLIYFVVPHHGQTNIMVYIGVCSLLGSLTYEALQVMSVRALGIALKLTLSGTNQLFYPQTWAFALIVATCVSTQINYLNKALDTFNTAVVSPIYYVMFTSLTIIASVIMFKVTHFITFMRNYCHLLLLSDHAFYVKYCIKCISSQFICALFLDVQDWDHQNPTQIVTEMCGFMTILSGTFLLHKTKDMTDSPGQSLLTRRPKHASQNAFAIEVMPLKCQDYIDDETLTLSLPKVENGYLKEEYLLRYKDSSIV
ncbi:putative magnesium transporter NIPA4 [Zea mays]|uniref:Probable magnesium transporter n=1 Tax=Zea mays TaxID=4577 RepID=A0A1D6F5E2_MAIZE|nr:putative magnesium transporter NIPA4 [Zea mays]